MTKKQIIKLIADAQRKLEKAHMAVRELPIENAADVITKLVDARACSSIAISRLENPQ